MKFLTLAAVAALTIGSVSQGFAASAQNLCQAKAIAKASAHLPASAVITEIVQNERAVLLSTQSQSLQSDINPAGSVDVTIGIKSTNGQDCELSGYVNTAEFDTRG